MRRAQFNGIEDAIFLIFLDVLSGQPWSLVIFEQLLGCLFMFLPNSAKQLQATDLEINISGLTIKIWMTDFSFFVHVDQRKMLISDVGHLFLCLLAICMCTLENCVYFLCLFLGWVVFDIELYVLSVLEFKLSFCHWNFF